VKLLTVEWFKPSRGH